MAIELISIGTNPNDGTGDPLRTAFSKCNDMFSELYSSSGTIGSNLSFSANTISGASNQNLQLSVSGTGEIIFQSDSVQIQQTRGDLSGSSVGLTGDSPGMIAWDSSYFYLCVYPYYGVLTTPDAPAGSGIGTGAGLPDGTYYAKIVAVDGQGYLTDVGPESTGVTTSSNDSIGWTWSTVLNAVSYQIWITDGVSGSEAYYFTSLTNNFSQTVVPSSGSGPGTPSATNDTGRIWKRTSVSVY